MQGDPKVDMLMRPVRATIERHVKDRAAMTEIYNRAYEVVMQCVDAKDGKTYCAYCGAEYPLDDNAATLVSEHIKTCAKHPMRAIEAEVTRLTTHAEKALIEVERLRGQLNSMMLVLQKYQPAGSPPPGDEIILATWILESLTAAFENANADAARLASTFHEYDGLCQFCGKGFNEDGDIEHAPDCPIVLHEKRLQGEKKNG